MGDPCGIGPEIILKALKFPAIRKIANYVIIGNKGVFDKTAKALNNPLKIFDDISYFGYRWLKNICFLAAHRGI